MAEPGRYLAFVGRISPEKRPDIAIRIAQHAGIRLKIAAKVDSKEEPYFRERIVPLLDNPLIEWLGQVDEQRKRALMAHALALLLPIDWPEPFGMVFIEALACGTPVLTCPRGAAPELLEEGVTGFSSDDVDELARAAWAVTTLSRQGCRAHARQRFDSSLMAMRYVDVYARLQGEERHPGVPDYELPRTDTRVRT